MKKLKLTKVMGSALVIASIFALNPMGVSASWKQDSNGWWWNTGNNSYVVGWRNIDGKWYYFSSDGYMVHDTTVDGYQIGSNGAWIQESEDASSNLKQKIRETVFNELTSGERQSVSGSWQDSEISKITLEDGMGTINDKSYIGKQVYLIDFPTKNEIEPNIITVFVDMNNYKIIGYGFVD
ncbi:hypothetical protein [Clostridium sp. BL-8]|uniref:hypothetical protein n=1 Tax=Clostridium sp. BL-8 TaxID=349938 RepID=UPI00098C441A|nr:hypothetical protein [Clostridium sp. BL-8]OOM78068.1 hypothetical protein CLOBL_26080 [Clostridium sp. BL-8]